MNKSKLFVSTLALSLLVAAPIVEEVKAEEVVNPDKYIPMSEADIVKYLKFTKVGGGYTVGLVSTTRDFTGEIHVPATYLGEPVIGVSASAFINSKASKIIFEAPKNIITIGTYAFHNVNLNNKLEFPNLTIVENSAFSNSKLAGLKLNPNKIIQIKDSAFRDSVIPNKLVFNNVTKIGYSAFLSAKIDELVFNSDVLVDIEYSAFYSIVSPKTELYLPKVKFLNENTFHASHLKSIILPNLEGSTKNNNFTGLHQSTYVFVPDSYKTNVTGPVYYGFIKYDTTPLGVELDMGGTFTQHRVVLTPILPTGGVDTNKDIREFTDDRTILYAGTDFDYDTQYSIDIYPLLGNTTTKITLPMDPFKKHLLDPVTIEVKKGGLTMEIVDQHPISAYVDLSEGYTYDTIPMSSAVQVNDYRGSEDLWTLQVSLAPIYLNGEKAEFIQMYANSLDIKFGENLKGQTEPVFTEVRPKDYQTRLLSESKIDINPGGGFGMYQHKFDSLDVVIDPRKVELGNGVDLVKLDTALIWTLSTEL